MNKIIALLFTLGCVIALGIAVMIYGWGLHPRSWWWIIGGGIFGQVFLRIIGEIITKSEN